MTDGLDDIGIDIPQGSVANQFCGVMLETGVPESLSEAVAVHLLKLKLVTPEKAHKTVCPLRELGLGYQREQNKKDGICETANRHHTYSLNFEVQMERRNSQSLNIGSMTILVSFIFFSRNSSNAACCFSLLTSP